MSETKDRIIKEEKKNPSFGDFIKPFTQPKDYLNPPRESGFLKDIDKLDINIFTIDNFILKSTFLSTNIINVDKLQSLYFKKTIPFYRGNALQDKAGKCEISKMLRHNQSKQMSEYEQFFERELQTDLNKFMTGQKGYSWRKLREEAQQKYNLSMDEIPNEGDLNKYFEISLTTLNNRMKKIIENEEVNNNLVENLGKNLESGRFFW